MNMWSKPGVAARRFGRAAAAPTIAQWEKGNMAADQALLQQDIDWCGQEADETTGQAPLTFEEWLAERGEQTRPRRGSRAHGQNLCSWSRRMRNRIRSRPICDRSRRRPSCDRCLAARRMHGDGAKRMFAASELPSAKTPSRDIHFHRGHRGRKPAECGHSWRIVRTTAPGPRGHFGPVSVSLGPLSPTQPNHGHFGTDVECAIIQRVGGRPKGVGFEKTPLRRSEQGSNCPIQRVRYSVVSAALPSAADATARRPEGRS